MVLKKQIVDSLFKTYVIKNIEKAVYEACSNGSDHIRLKVIDKINLCTVDLSKTYLELILLLEPVHYEFYEKESSNNQSEKWLLVQLDLKNQNVKLCYAEALENEIFYQNKLKKEIINHRECLENAFKELNRKELQKLVDKYEESEDIYKFRKSYGYNFKKFRLMIKDHLRYEV